MLRGVVFFTKNATCLVFHVHNAKNQHIQDLFGLLGIVEEIG